jgi:hypothetical protein
MKPSNGWKEEETITGTDGKPITQPPLAAPACSVSRRTVTTIQELRDFLRPFTNECPLTYEDGRPCFIAYTVDADCNGRVFVGVVKQNTKLCYVAEKNQPTTEAKNL